MLAKLNEPLTAIVAALVGVAILLFLSNRGVLLKGIGNAEPSANGLPRPDVSMFEWDLGATLKQHYFGERPNMPFPDYGPFPHIGGMGQNTGYGAVG